MKTRMMMSSVAALVAASLATAGFAQDNSATSNADSIETPAPAASTDMAPAGDASATTAASGAMGGETGTNFDDTQTGTAVGAAPAEADVATDTAAGGVSGATDTNAEMSYGTLMEGMQTNADFSGEVSGVTADSNVQMVKLSELEGAEEAAALDKAMEDNSDALTTARGAVGANTDLTAMLEAEGYTADDVIAVRTGADGTVHVVVDDRS